MDFWVLGAAAAVAIAVALWVFWLAPPAAEEELAGGVAAVRDAPQEAVVEATPTKPNTTDEPRSSPTLAYELRSSPTLVREIDTRESPGRPAQQRTVGLTTAALLTLGGAVGGAFIYSLWRQKRPGRRFIK
jgi:hypothetical protein